MTFETLHYETAGRITRHSPEGMWFRPCPEAHGFREAVRLRDSGEPIPGSKR